MKNPRALCFLIARGFCVFSVLHQEKNEFVGAYGQEELLRSIVKK